MVIVHMNKCNQPLIKKYIQKKRLDKVIDELHEMGYIDIPEYGEMEME